MNIHDGVAVAGDEAKLSQVMLNLVNNAQQALMEVPEPRRLRIETLRDDEQVFLRVMDSGPGVSTEVAERIFEPFFTTKPAGTGTGIGLAICRQFVEAHGGALTLESEAGWGAVFSVCLPLLGKTHDTPLPDPENAVETSSRRSVDVLVVEDEPEVAETIAAILQSRGHRTSIAGSGREAIDHLRKQEPDVIISDIRMSDLDGLALLETLRDEYPAMASRIGFLTGDTLGPGTVKFLSKAGRPYANKPFSVDDLLELVDKLHSAG